MRILRSVQLSRLLALIPLPLSSTLPSTYVCVLFQVSVTCSPRNLLAKAKNYVLYLRSVLYVAMYLRRYVAYVVESTFVRTTYEGTFEGILLDLRSY